MWIFGYGSLMWKFNLPFEEATIGYVKGYNRRFYQYSTNHRGTPSRPGRVVTLVPSQDPETKVFGLAYRISEQDKESAIQTLDQREQEGYIKVVLPFYPQHDEGNPFDILVYIAEEDNPQYAGPAEVEEIVADILASAGPSGTNIEYVRNLAESMRLMVPGVQDEHLFSIETKVSKGLNNDVNSSNEK